MPNLTKPNHDRLYTAVEKAHGLGRLFSVSFVTSNTRPTPQDVVFMKSQLEQSSSQTVVDDPTLVLVILGYADKQGDDKRNVDISTNRAHEVADGSAHSMRGTECDARSADGRDRHSRSERAGEEPDCGSMGGASVEER